jgi:hypothetical protein
MDVANIEAVLERIEEGVREARAATELLREGDASAMAELDGVVDELAREVAELKSQTATSF